MFYLKSRLVIFMASTLLTLGLVGCTSNESAGQEIPLVSLEQLGRYGEMTQLAAPMTVRDYAYTQTSYNAKGELVFLELDRELFPTDVVVYFTQDMLEPIVFLARAPHSRCILKWNIDNDGLLRDPCFGSVYTPEGKYIAGPSPRDLDVIPSFVENGVLWLEPRIIYGEPHP